LTSSADCHMFTCRRRCQETKRYQQKKHLNDMRDYMESQYFIIMQITEGLPITNGEKHVPTTDKILPSVV
jgi:hypothetical protein